MKMLCGDIMLALQVRPPAAPLLPMRCVLLHAAARCGSAAPLAAGVYQVNWLVVKSAARAHSLRCRAPLLQPTHPLPRAAPARRARPHPTCWL